FHAARLITRIEALAEQLQTEQHTGFDPPYTTLNVGLISGGTAKNITAGECRFTLEWRPVPGKPPEHVLDLVEKEIERLRASDAEFDCRIERARINSAMETPADSPLVCALEEATRRRAGTVSFGTEAPQMRELGAEAVILGPGDIRVAHRTGEFVPVAELRDCVRIISRMIERFCM
ncbi:MAG: M20/M25/M40 family metallo-hydrolase, partial [Acidobacteria bacterium]|nr:M20/M25/M40 family metallo-hydrolase [Acidobacteriota bacterium]